MFDTIFLLFVILQGFLVIYYVLSRDSMERIDRWITLLYGIISIALGTLGLF